MATSMPCMPRVAYASQPALLVEIGNVADDGMDEELFLPQVVFERPEHLAWQQFFDARQDRIRNFCVAWPDR